MENIDLLETLKPLHVHTITKVSHSAWCKRMAYAGSPKTTQLFILH